MSFFQKPNNMSSDNIDITPKQDGGVLKRILRAGEGIAKPSVGTTVKVHYVGTLENGNQFDSSRDRGDQFSFVLGRGQVIKGWDVGVASMTRGELAVFTIRSDYGYGDAGSPPKIPGGATLIFEVELFEWAAEDISPDKDGSILRTVIVEGSKNASPNDTSQVTAHIVGSYQGKEFYNQNVTFSIGEGSEQNLPEGVDRALRRFQLGEKSKIELRGTRFTYGNNPPPGTDLPPNAPLEFTIFLKEFEKVPSTWEMTAEQKLEAAKQAKERGTFFFQKGNLKLAFNKYKRVEDVLEYEKTTDPEQKKERDALLLSAYLNLSLVTSKQNEQVECLKWCEKALDISPDNVKALYRKGGAMFAMCDIREALEIFEKIVQLAPDNKAAVQQVLTCKAKLREQNERDKKRYKNLFSKIADEPTPGPSGENSVNDNEPQPSTSSESTASQA